MQVARARVLRIATLVAASLSGVLPVHLRDDDIAEVNGNETAVTDVEEVGAERGVAAPDDENVILRLAVPDSKKQSDMTVRQLNLIVVEWEGRHARTYRCSTPQSSLYSPYHSKARRPRLLKKPSQYSDWRN